jgi:hypothetical protein
MKAALWSTLGYLALKFVDAPIGEAATLACNVLKPEFAGLAAAWLRCRAVRRCPRSFGTVRAAVFALRGHRLDQRFPQRVYASEHTIYHVLCPRLGAERTPMAECPSIVRFTDGR